MTLFKRSVLAIFAILSLGNVMAQNTLGAEELSSAWTLLKEEGDVKFYIRKDECQMGSLEKPFSYAFIKIENSSSAAKTVDFHVAVHFQSECVGCDANAETVKSVTVEANSSVETDCKFENGHLSVLIQNPNFDSRVFKEIELMNFKAH